MLLIKLKYLDNILTTARAVEESFGSERDSKEDGYNKWQQLLLDQFRFLPHSVCTARRCMQLPHPLSPSIPPHHWPASSAAAIFEPIDQHTKQLLFSLGHQCVIPVWLVTWSIVWLVGWLGLAGWMATMDGCIDCWCWVSWVVLVLLVKEESGFSMKLKQNRWWKRRRGRKRWN